jgi:hypothetical protein
MCLVDPETERPKRLRVLPLIGLGGIPDDCIEKPAI